MPDNSNPSCRIAPPAEFYSYTLYRVSNPAVGNPEGNSDAELVAADVRIGSAGNAFTHSDVTFYIGELTDGLYKVKVKSHNPLYAAGVPSEYSDVIGTGAAPQLGC